MDTTRKDFLKQDIKVGDYVVYGTTMHNGRGLIIGKIINFTPKMVKVERFKNGIQHTHITHSMYADHLMKVDENALALYLLIS